MKPLAEASVSIKCLLRSKNIDMSFVDLSKDIAIMYSTTRGRTNGVISKGSFRSSSSSQEDFCKFSEISRCLTLQGVQA